MTLQAYAEQIGYNENTVLSMKQGSGGHYRITPNTMLTIQEITILNFVSDGYRYMNIAANLAITENTVKTHIRHILFKLNADTVPEAVAIAIRQSIIQ